MTNQRGITLVELVATLAIVGMVGTLAYAVLFQGYANYERVQAETKLRDEADLIMANFVRELFVLKSNELEESPSCLNGAPGSCVSVTKEDSGESYFVGFQQDNASSDVAIVRNEEIRFYNDDVQLVPNRRADSMVNNSISSDDGIRYTVQFVLSTEYRGQTRQMEFVNTINVISNDGAGGGE